MKRIIIVVSKKRFDALHAIMKKTGRTQASLIDEAIRLVKKHYRKAS